MSEPDLRDLLHDHAGAVPGRDLIDGAWTRGRAVRRRRAAGAAAVTAALVVAASVGAGAMLGGGARPEGVAPAAPSASKTRAVSEPVAPFYDTRSTEPDGRLDGAPVYDAPTPAQEAGLAPMTQSRPRLPAIIDLTAEAPDAESEPLPYAEAAFGTSGTPGSSRSRVLLVLGEEQRSLDLGRLGAEVGFGDTTLSPGGDFLQFRRSDGVDVFTIATGEWSHLDLGGPAELQGRTVSWVGDDSLWLPDGSGAGPTYDVRTGVRDGAVAEGTPADRSPLDLGDDAYAQGRGRDGAHGEAQSWGRTGERSVLVAATDGGADVLRFVGRPPESYVPVASWAAPDVVVYQSDAEEPRLLAWRLGTHDVTVLTTLTGAAAVDSWVGSYARWWARFDHPDRETS